MAAGVDYAFPPHPNITQLANVGKTFACRYGGPGSASKQLTLDEAKALNAAGLTVVANAEGSTAGLTGGFNVGAAWARDAEAHFATCGMPRGRPIYLSVDFDVQASQWASVATALRGAASVIGLNRVGVYGGRHAIEWARRDNVATWFWQTYAWSNGFWVPGNHIEQYQNDVVVAGASVDLDRSLKSDFGQWTVNGAEMETEGQRNVGYMIQNGMVGVEEPVLHIPAESGYPPLNLTNPFATVIRALFEGHDAAIPAFAAIPARNWINGTARDLGEIKDAIANLTTQPIDYVKLALALKPIIAQECEAAVRRVLGSLDNQ